MNKLILAICLLLGTCSFARADDPLYTSGDRVTHMCGQEAVVISSQWVVMYWIWDNNPGKPGYLYKVEDRELDGHWWEWEITGKAVDETP